MYANQTARKTVVYARNDGEIVSHKIADIATEVAITIFILKQSKVAQDKEDATRTSSGRQTVNKPGQVYHIAQCFEIGLGANLMSNWPCIDLRQQFRCGLRSDSRYLKIGKCYYSVSSSWRWKGSAL